MKEMYKKSVKSTGVYWLSQVSVEPISSTLKRKQEERAAKVIQRAFRKGQESQEEEKAVAEASLSPSLGHASE